MHTAPWTGFTEVFVREAFLDYGNGIFLQVRCRCVCVKSCCHGECV